jgi:hypothetical protein
MVNATHMWRANGSPENLEGPLLAQLHWRDALRGSRLNDLSGWNTLVWGKYKDEPAKGASPGKLSRWGKPEAVAAEPAP